MSQFHSLTSLSDNPRRFSLPTYSTIHTYIQSCNIFGSQGAHKIPLTEKVAKHFAIDRVEDDRVVHVVLTAAMSEKSINHYNTSFTILYHLQ